MGKIRKFLLDLADRSGWTFLQALSGFVVTAGVSGALTGSVWAGAIGTALWSVAYAIGTTVVTGAWEPKSSGRFGTILVIGWRGAKTFVQVALGALTAGGTTDAFHAGWSGAFVVALPAAVIAAVKAVGALADSRTPGASSIPTTAYLGQPVIDHTANIPGPGDPMWTDAVTAAGGSVTVKPAVPKPPPPHDETDPFTSGL